MKPILKTVSHCLFFLALLSSEVVAAEHFNFKKQQIEFGFADKNIANLDLWHPPSPFFWGSRAKVDSGQTLLYEHLIYHTPRFFSVYAGGSISDWQYENTTIAALTALLELRVWLYHFNGFNPYFTYSIAAPTLLTREKLNGLHLGSFFIFQDFIGFGVQLGKKHALNLSAKIYHYSNGDLFAENPGFGANIVFGLGVSW